MSRGNRLAFRGWKTGVWCLLLCLVAAMLCACGGNHAIDTIEDEVVVGAKQKDCDHIDNKKDCKKVDGCIWNKDQNLCHAEDDCQYYDSKKDCQKVDGCIWNKEQDLCHAEDACQYYDNKKDCQEVDGCAWSKDHHLCHAEDDCQYYDNKKDCQGVDGCAWNKDLDMCHAEDDCQYYDSKKDCQKVDGCIWNKEQDLCHAEDACQYYDNKKDCQGVDGCAWNKDLDMCHAEDDCQYYNNKKDCQEVDGCTWNKDLDLCHAEDDCHYYDNKKDCQEVDGCTWDKDEQVCHTENDEDPTPLESCADNESYVDAEGYTCEDWVGYDCHTAVEEWGYSIAEVAELLKNCPLSCELCPMCKDTVGYEDADGYACEDWVGYDCQAAVEDWGYSEEEEEDLISNCPESCELCEECSDTVGYEDVDGYACEEWIGYDCFDAIEKWGYSPAEEADLIRNCPDSCELCPE